MRGICWRWPNPLTWRWRPAADMFEMGVKVQVLKRGTMFAQRGQRLAEFYRRYQSFEEAPTRRGGKPRDDGART